MYGGEFHRHSRGPRGHIKGSRGLLEARGWRLQSAAGASLGHGGELREASARGGEAGTGARGARGPDAVACPALKRRRWFDGRTSTRRCRTASCRRAQMAQLSILKGGAEQAGGAKSKEVRKSGFPAWGSPCSGRAAIPALCCRSDDHPGQLASHRGEAP